MFPPVRFNLRAYCHGDGAWVRAKESVFGGIRLPVWLTERERPAII
jgi:hypothetical protein